MQRLSVQLGRGGPLLRIVNRCHPSKLEFNIPPQFTLQARHGFGRRNAHPRIGDDEIHDYLGQRFTEPFVTEIPPCGRLACLCALPETSRRLPATVLGCRRW